MIELSSNTIAKITPEIDYVKSRAFDIKSQLRKTQKRTGLTRAEISVIVAKGMGKTKPSETYLEKLTSLGRFKKHGDIHDVYYKKIIQLMSCIN